MNGSSIASVAARYAIGGTIMSIFLHSVVTGGGFLATVWLYGIAMAPLTLAFAVAPSILSTPGAMLAHRMDLEWRMACAALSTALLTLILVLWLNWGEVRGESLLFVPLASIAAIPAFLVDWAASRRARLRSMPTWLRTIGIAALMAGITFIAIGTTSTLRNPPQLTWP